MTIDLDWTGNSQGCNSKKSLFVPYAKTQCVSRIWTHDKPPWLCGSLMKPRMELLRKLLHKKQRPTCNFGGSCLGKSMKTSFLMHSAGTDFSKENLDQFIYAIFTIVYVIHAFVHTLLFYDWNCSYVSFCTFVCAYNHIESHTCTVSCTRIPIC